MIKKLLNKIYNKIIFSLFLILGLSITTSGWSNSVETSKNSANVLIAVKAFNKADCEKYLDRDLLGKGYQPIQIIIKNTSDKTLIFSPDQISLPCASIEQVVKRVHTSTAGRITGYTAAAVLTSGLFLIPAIIDGVGSSNANKALDADYFAKAAKRQRLPPNSQLNGLLFIPIGSYTSSFEITLMEEGNNEAHEVTVTTFN